jgi:formylglycine-generating enzyme required for sulfatase activity
MNHRAGERWTSTRRAGAITATAVAVTLLFGACVRPPERNLGLRATDAGGAREDGSSRPGGDAEEDAAAATDGPHADTGDFAQDARVADSAVDVDADALASMDAARPCTPSVEDCNGVDDDCDGQTDEGTLCGIDDRCVAGACERVPPVGYVRIAPGSFMMGSAVDASEHRPNELRHRVEITRPFALKTTEVTEREWRLAMGELPWPPETCGADCPVTNMSWAGAAQYCNALSRMAGLAPCYDERLNFAGPGCRGYRLPTEAEWEYAARAGAETELSSGPLTEPGCSPLDPNVDVVGWYCGNSMGAQMARPVGTKAPNPWGVFDMHGNVNEWVNDWYDPGYGAQGEHAIDPLGPASGEFRTSRGGSWVDEGRFMRASFRTDRPADSSVRNLGFRPAMWL